MKWIASLWDSHSEPTLGEVIFPAGNTGAGVNSRAGEDNNSNPWYIGCAQFAGSQRGCRGRWPTQCPTYPPWNPIQAALGPTPEVLT